MVFYQEVWSGGLGFGSSQLVHRSSPGPSAGSLSEIQMNFLLKDQIQKLSYCTYCIPDRGCSKPGCSLFKSQLSWDTGLCIYTKRTWRPWINTVYNKNISRWQSCSYKHTCLQHAIPVIVSLLVCVHLYYNARDRYVDIWHVQSK